MSSAPFVPKTVKEDLRHLKMILRKEKTISHIFYVDNMDQRSRESIKKTYSPIAFLVYVNKQPTKFHTKTDCAKCILNPTMQILDAEYESHKPRGYKKPFKLSNHVVFDFADTRAEDALNVAQKKQMEEELRRKERVAKDCEQKKY